MTRSRAGIYTCIGSNQEGDGESNPLNLDIKCEYIPYLIPNDILIIIMQNDSNHSLGNVCSL